MTKDLTLLTFLLLTGVAQSLQAQAFKVGDYVDAHISGGWLPCMVSKPLQANEYGVSCGATDYMVTASPQPACSTCGAIRARVATLQDGLIAMETALAKLQLASRGINRFIDDDSKPANGPGATYGTREPKTCATRTAPADGAPSAEQAREYFICDAENVLGNSLFLVTDVKVQVAAVSHPPNQVVKEMHAADLDPNQPVWDIRGSFAHYQCSRAGATDNDFARTHNCSVTEQPAATGYCFKSTLGDWHCVMPDAQSAGATQRYKLPPDGN